MQAVVIYESLTGHTRHAAECIGRELVASGGTATVCPILAIDYQALSEAELVIVGTWTDGAVFVGQRPGRAGRLRKLPALVGKRSVVYCTYAVNPGRTLEKLTAIVEERGATVLGGLAIRRDRTDAGARDLVGRALAAVAR
jgi:hypothetical protein